MSGPQSRVTIISVCYQSAAVIPNMLASLPSGTPVVLVDNASNDLSALEPLAEAYNATLICNDRNLGFGVACNQAAAMAETEFLLFLNPDAMLSPTALTELVNAAERYPKASAMNPRITNARGLPYFKWYSSLLPRGEFMTTGWPPQDREVSVLDGCALFVRRSDFEAVGGFDPAIFLYHEDDDLSRRLRARCGPLMFIHAACVTHLGGRSSASELGGLAFKGWHFGRSRVYAMRTHGRPLSFLRSLLDAIGDWRVLYSRRWRIRQWAYFRGVLSTLRDGGAAQPLVQQTVVKIRRNPADATSPVPHPVSCPID